LSLTKHILDVALHIFCNFTNRAGRCMCEVSMVWPCVCQSYVREWIYFSKR